MDLMEHLTVQQQRCVGYLTSFVDVLTRATGPNLLSWSKADFATAIQWTTFFEREMTLECKCRRNSNHDTTRENAGCGVNGHLTDIVDQEDSICVCDWRAAALYLTSSRRMRFDLGPESLKHATRLVARSWLMVGSLCCVPSRSDCWQPRISR